MQLLRNLYKHLRKPEICGNCQLATSRQLRLCSSSLASPCPCVTEHPAGVHHNRACPKHTTNLVWLDNTKSPLRRGTTPTGICGMANTGNASDVERECLREIPVHKCNNSRSYHLASTPARVSRHMHADLDSVWHRFAKDPASRACLKIAIGDRDRLFPCSWTDVFIFYRS